MSLRNELSALSPDALKQAAWYAAAFGATAGLATSADAQVLYGDPDDILVSSTYADDGSGGFTLDGIELDLDLDGDSEIFLVNRGPDQSSTPYTFVLSDFPGDEPEGDYLSNIVGQNREFQGVDYPYFAPLSAGYVIPDSVGLNNDFIETYPSISTFTYNGDNPLNLPTDEDSYIGIEFTLNGDTDPTVHYGWIRIELLSDSQGFIVKDYGFNATPEGSIEVGEIGTPISTASEEDVAAVGYAIRTLGANPFSASGTRLQVEVAQAEQVRAEVYNALGQRVEVLYNSALAGAKTLQFGSNYAPGLYVVRVTGESFQQTLKVTRN